MATLPSVSARRAQGHDYGNAKSAVRRLRAFNASVDLSGKGIEYAVASARCHCCGRTNAIILHPHSQVIREGAKVDDDGPTPGGECIFSALMMSSLAISTSTRRAWLESHCSDTRQRSLTGCGC